MSITIDKVRAGVVLEEEAARETAGAAVPRSWEEQIERLSEACQRSSKTHIAMLGTALLAKACALEADAHSVKAGAETAGAYSARGLCHGVLVPRSALLGVHLGVTGREPLNNQPYFRVRRATLDTLIPLVRGHAQEPVRLLVAVLDRVALLDSEAAARDALRAFVRVRRRHAPRYPTAPSSPPAVTRSGLIRHVVSFVSDTSEGGKRAQAVAAGFMDVLRGPERVDSGRINDPDRHLAGDVGVAGTGSDAWERVFEVRDKAVTTSDLRIFAQKAATAGVRRAAVLAVDASQRPLDVSATVAWADQQGVSFSVFFGWPRFIEEVLFWCEMQEVESVPALLRFVRQRLIEVEASPAAVRSWDATRQT